MIPETSKLWSYFSPSEKVLAGDGNFLLTDSAIHRDEEPTDYSYIVFPFAKLYEGFLKHAFFDLGIIGDREYRGEFYRIGKALSPGLAGRLKERSAYRQIARRYSPVLAENLWKTWKNGRNLVFHYFPHNYHALTLAEAKTCVGMIVNTMEQVIVQTGIVDRTLQK